jgi:hypothetical protein
MAKEEKSFDGEVTNQLSPLVESFYVEPSTNLEISVTSNVPWFIVTSPVTKEEMAFLSPLFHLQILVPNVPAICHIQEG